MSHHGAVPAAHGSFSAAQTAPVGEEPGSTMARLRAHFIGRTYPAGSYKCGQEIPARSGRMRYIRPGAVQSGYVLCFLRLGAVEEPCGPGLSWVCGAPAAGRRAEAGLGKEPRGADPRLGGAQRPAGVTFWLTLLPDAPL